MLPPAGLACLAAVSALGAEVPLIDLARHEQYRDMKISPDGAFLAVTSIIKGKAVLSIIRRSDLQIGITRGVNVHGSYSSEIADFAWTGPRQVVYSMGHFGGRHEAPLPTGALYIVNADGARNRHLYGGSVGVALIVADLVAALPDDPRHALISRYRYVGAGSADVPSEVDRIDLETGTTRRVAEGPVGRAEFIADNRGVVRVAYGRGTDWAQKVYYRADDSAAWTLIHDEAEDDSEFRPVLFDRGGKNLYVVCDGADHVGGVCLWNTSTSAVTTLWSGTEAGPTEFILTADNKDLFAIGSTPDRPTISLIDRDAPDAALLSSLHLRFPGQDVTLGSSTRDGSKRVIVVQSDINPGDFYLYDSDTNNLTKVLSRMPWIKPETMAQMEPVKLAARDGLPLHGYLTRPLDMEGEKHLPLVVFVHGGPYGIRDEWGFDADAQILASRGYAVLQVNFRGSGGYGRAFAKAGRREWGAKMQDDITDATRWAIAEGIADPHRICIYGASYGGYAALQGAVSEPDLYACAIGAEGIYDLPAWIGTSDVGESHLGLGYIHNVLGADATELRERSPINHLDRLKAKVLLIVGGADLRVPPSQGEKLHEALAQHHIEHDWIYHVNEGHGIYDVGHRVDAYEKILAFLDRNIGTADQTKQ